MIEATTDLIAVCQLRQLAGSEAAAVLNPAPVAFIDL